MTNDDDVTISEDGQLTLAKASKQHEGEWKCQATNSEGTIEQTMQVLVKMPIMGKNNRGRYKSRNGTGTEWNRDGTHPLL